MALERGDRSRDLAIPKGYFIQILDRTKGHIQTVAGPNKISMADTEVPVVMQKDGTYRECDSPEDALQKNIVARLGQYVILTNPAKENASHKNPEEGKSSLPPELEIGSGVNIRGPVSFSLWWEQTAQVLDGHQLRSNQYLLVEVTDADLAKKNWGKAVFAKSEVVSDSTKNEESNSGKSEKVEGKEIESGVPKKVDVAKGQSEKRLSGIDPEKFVIGQRIIIRGTEASFFIPPTGMKVVPEENGKYVREAVTLESLQYCVLLGENGEKRYVQGPAVVFPEATETFTETLTEKGSKTRVFKAIGLNPISGIHSMVIADYEEDGQTVKAGTELFITGAKTSIYFPRKEHAIIKYGDGEIVHYAVSIPSGEGRYVLDKTTGLINLVKGPKMLLLDPTKEVYIMRILPESMVRLLFPGNNQALDVNRVLANQAQQTGDEYVSSEPSDVLGKHMMLATRSFSKRLDEEASEEIPGDTIKRKTRFTPPRSLVLDSKYQGAVAVSIWPGYAIQVVRKDGRGRVEVGPKTVLLEYDEILTRLSLSTGKPKTTDTLFSTVYLKLAGNQVSDIVRVETLDGIQVDVKLSYQIEFFGDNSKWFEVDNYVKLVTDHCRSLLRGVAKQRNITDLMAGATNIIRDTILGVKSTTEGRPGQKFPQSNARIYDVEVLAVEVVDRSVAAMITSAQQEIIRGTLDLTRKEQQLNITKKTQGIEREILAEQDRTCVEKHKLALAESGRELEKSLAVISTRLKSNEATKRSEEELQEIQHSIELASLEQQKLISEGQRGIRTANAEAERLIREKLQQLDIELAKAQTEAVKARLGSIGPDLIKAIQSSNDRDALVKVAESMGIAAYIKNNSIAATLGTALQGTPLADTFSKLLTAVGSAKTSNEG